MEGVSLVIPSSGKSKSRIDTAIVCGKAKAHVATVLCILDWASIGIRALCVTIPSVDDGGTNGRVNTRPLHDVLTSGLAIGI